jgi:uncharacterized protein with von Willebrand factor type A (vWA) domain
MVTDPASAIKREVLQLVEVQIDTLRRTGCLTASDLADYHTRSEKITELYQRIDRIGRTRVDLRSARAS